MGKRSYSGHTTILIREPGLRMRSGIGVSSVFVGVAWAPTKGLKGLNDSISAALKSAGAIWLVGGRPLAMRDASAKKPDRAAFALPVCNGAGCEGLGPFRACDNEGRIGVTIIPV